MDDLVSVYAEMMLASNTKRYARQGMTRVLTAQYAYVGDMFAGSPIRLLYVGRAVNGWNEDYCWLQGSMMRELALETAKTVLAKWQGYRAEDMPYQGASFRNQFWGLARDLVCALAKEEDCRDTWIRKLAWTNLYKIAPREHGNPNETLKDAQLPYARDVLRHELLTLQPTHVVFVTDTNWYEPFAHVVEEAKGEIGFRSVVVTRPEVRQANMNTERKELINREFGLSM